jgi:hypothetical protein
MYQSEVNSVDLLIPVGFANALTYLITAGIFTPSAGKKERGIIIAYKRTLLK